MRLEAADPKLKLLLRCHLGTVVLMDKMHPKSFGLVVGDGDIDSQCFVDLAENGRDVLLASVQLAVEPHDPPRWSRGRLAPAALPTLMHNNEDLHWPRRVVATPSHSAGRRLSRWSGNWRLSEAEERQWAARPVMVGLAAS